MSRHGGPEALVVCEVATPSPGAGQVRVRVLAAGVNNTDIWTREGRYGTPGDPDAVAGWTGVPIATPRIQGADVAGIVDAVGPGVDGGIVGRRVIVDPATYEDATPDADPVAILGSEYDGGFAECCVVAQQDVHDVTSSPLSDVELACLPIAYGTAAGMLGRGRAASGETVVVTGASGGVGTALVQLASAAGLVVVAVSTESKASQLVDLGASTVVDRRSARLADDIAAAAPGGVDLVADVVGGPLFHLWPGLLARRGRVVVAGAFAGAVVSIDLRQLYLGQRRIIGSTMHTREHFARLVDVARQGSVRPPVAQVFPLERIHEAQQAMRATDTLGKVVVAIGDEGQAPREDACRT
jgi:NADPH:quinone reductase-like Zn-dependent oxidoreductase